MPTSRESQARTLAFARVVGCWLVIVPSIIGLRVSEMSALASEFFKTRRLKVGFVCLHKDSKRQAAATLKDSFRTCVEDLFGIHLLLDAFSDSFVSGRVGHEPRRVGRVSPVKAPRPWSQQRYRLSLGSPVGLVDGDQPGEQGSAQCGDPECGKGVADLPASADEQTGGERSHNGTKSAESHSPTNASGANRRGVQQRP